MRRTRLQNTHRKIFKVMVSPTGETQVYTDATTPTTPSRIKILVIGDDTSGRTTLARLNEIIDGPTMVVSTVSSDCVEFVFSSRRCGKSDIHGAIKLHSYKPIILHKYPDWLALSRCYFRKQIPVVRKINFVRLNRSSKDRRINKWKNHKRDCFKKAL